MQGRIGRILAGRILAVVGIAGALLSAPANAIAAEPLSFFKNYFVTGDYAVRGVSLWRAGDSNGFAVGKIPALGGAGGVPANSDILAAFLYVQTTESVQGSGIEHATFNGIDLGPFTAPGSAEPGSGTVAKPLVTWGQNAPDTCWAVTYPGGRKVITYRADVLRFLPIDPTTGKHDLTLRHVVAVPDAGRAFADVSETGNETKWSSKPRALGASLLVIYRDPGKPLSAIVIYDGAYKKDMLARMDQEILGFYQSSSTSPSATMTHIVGDGHKGRSEQVLLDGVSIATNPYANVDGVKWDNPTFRNLPLRGDKAGTTVTIDKFGTDPDCVTFSSIVFKTTVQDSDGDALLDVWEESDPPPFDVSDPENDPAKKTRLPNLAAMGARKDQKDLFVEIDYMRAAKGTRYGGVPVDSAHDHLPEKAALEKVADAFFKAGVNVHFDVGDHHQEPPESYVIATSALGGAEHPGGESISETLACQDPDAPDPDVAKPAECLHVDPGVDPMSAEDDIVTQLPLPGQYPNYPGTVGWKTGFQVLRDELLGFDRNRKDIFHYVLFAHAIGIPKDECLNADGSQDFHCQLCLNADGTVDPECTPNPDFHIPRTNSGIADFPGADVLVTLGAFRNSQNLPIGTTYMQASTLMHELGHNFELTHAGLQSLDPAIPRERNCKPLYFSVMNYLYQLRGLPDADGKIQLDYSRSPTGSLNELVSESTPISGPYRAGWYAPWTDSYLEDMPNAKPAQRHCNGSELAEGELMVRVDAPSVGLPLDWDTDHVNESSTAYELDVNFDGYWDLTPSPVVTVPDWAGLRFSQMGGRRSPGGWYLDAERLYRLGPLSLDVGRGDIGRGDIGRGDIGRGDIGRGDIGRGDIGVAVGRGDIGRGDIGRGDIGRGDIGRGDIGRGDIGRGDIGRGVFGLGDLDVGGDDEPFYELDLETALAVSGDAPPPPNELSACLTVDGLCALDGGGTPVRLTWTAPPIGQPDSYSIYRFNVEGPLPPATLPAEPIAVLSGTYGAVGTPLWNRWSLATTYLDHTPAPGETVAYFVTAHFADGTETGSWTSISNFAIVHAQIGTRLQLFRETKAPGVYTPGPNIPGGYFGQPVTVRVQLDTEQMLFDHPVSGTLTVSLDGQALGPPLDGSAPRSFSFPSVAHPELLSVGDHTMRVAYSGDAYYSPASLEAKISVKAPVGVGTQRYYSIVCDDTANWSTAASSAAALSYLGARGHLATITTAPEDVTIAQLVAEAGAPSSCGDLAYFLGGLQSVPTGAAGEPDGFWGWITNEPWEYTGWGYVFGQLEPNNGGGTTAEDTLLYWAPHSTNGGGWGDGTASPVGGYVVEFEPPQPSYTWQLVSDTVCMTYDLVGTPADVYGVPFTCDATSVDKTISNAVLNPPTPTNPTDTNFYGWIDQWRDANGLWGVNGLIDAVPCTPGQGHIYRCTAPAPSVN